MSFDDPSFESSIQLSSGLPSGFIDQWACRLVGPEGFASGSTLILWPTVAVAHETNASSRTARKFLTLIFYDAFRVLEAGCEGDERASRSRLRPE
jgi:hypothetical protein